MVSLLLEKIQRIATKKWFRSLLVLFLLYKSIFNAYSADALLPRLVNQFTNSELEVDTKTFSLFFGFESNSLKLRTKGLFVNESIFEAKRVALRYNLFSLLLLKLKISEVAIDSGTLFLHEKGGIWNYSTIVKPSGSNREEPKTPTEPLEEIKTYVPLLAQAHLNIEQFHLRYWKESDKRMLADVYDFNLRIDLLTNRFTSIPLSIDLLDQIDNFYLALNPNRSVPIEVDSADLNWKQTLPISLLLDWKNDSKNPVFLFSTNIGSDQIQLEYKKRAIQFGLSLDQHVEYYPEKDEVLFKRFFVKVLGDTWIALEGNISNLRSPEPSVDINVKESKIHFSPVSRLISQLPGILPPITLNGDVSLEGTSVSGKWSEVGIKLKLLASNVVFAFGNARKHAIKSAEIDLNSKLNLSSKDEKTSKDPLPFLQSFRTNQFTLVYNEMILNLEANLENHKNINVTLLLENLNLSEFTNAVGGKVKGKIIVNAVDFSYLPVNLDLSIENFRYAIDRSRSPSSRINLFGNIGLSFDRPFGLSSLNLSGISLAQKTISGGKALGLDLIGSVNLGSGATRIQTSRANITSNIPFLLQTLPLMLKEKIAPLQSTLGNDPSFNVKSDISLSEHSQKFFVNLTGVLPGLELTDLNLILDASIAKNKENTIRINSAKVNAYQKIANLELSGYLEERPGFEKAPLGKFFGNIDAKFSLNSSEKKYLLKGISFFGNLDLTAKIRDFDITGSLNSKHSSIYQSNQKCPGVDCRMFLVEDLQTNIPFQHNLAWKKKDSLIVGDKSVFIKTYGRSAEPNLKISQIIGTHPSIPDLPFEYIKKQGSAPGLSARIDYRENYATIEDLTAYSLDGIILGKNLVFNVGTGDPAFMEFRGNVQIRDIDLKQLMAPKTRDKIDDGKIKADLNISIRDLTEPIANMDLFFYIFQIGSDFGKSALNVISQQNLLIDRIADSYSVKKIDVSLSKGLVYADVFFRRSILSIFINLEDSKISQQRMPLANFLKRAQSEIQSYQ